MAKSVADIAVNVFADTSALSAGLKRGAKDVDGFGAKATAMAATVTKAGLAITAGLTAAAGAGYALAKSAAETGAEIERLSRLVGLTPEAFQRMAAGARTVGIEQDKLADILKDVQDRVGDFLQTGGGPMKDFFENIAPQIGVTAEQFKNLNSGDALQLFITSLQRANLTQSEMTFYMEAMASDLSLLYPLLQDNGAAMKRYGDEAEAAGAILSNEAVNGSSDLRAELEQLETVIRNKMIEAILDNKYEIGELAKDITEVWIPALVNVALAMGKVVGAITDAIKAYKELRDLISEGDVNFSGNPFGGDAFGGPGDGVLTPDERDPLSGTNRGNPSLLDFYNNMGRDSTEGGMGADTLGFLPSQDAMDAELERLSEHEDRIREILTEGQNARFQVLSDGYAAQMSLAEEAADKEVAVEQMKAAAKRAAVAGAFGDLASLMASENEKLFKIGKAAAIAEASVSGYNAAVAAWEKGMEVGGPGVAAAFTAASLVRTGALISSIASQNIGGGGGGGGGAGASAGGSAPVPTSTYYIDLQGDTFSRDSVRQTILTVMQSEIDRGGQVIFGGR